MSVAIAIRLGVSSVLWIHSSLCQTSASVWTTRCVYACVYVCAVCFVWVVGEGKNKLLTLSAHAREGYSSHFVVLILKAADFYPIKLIFF